MSVSLVTSAKNGRDTTADFTLHRRLTVDLMRQNGRIQEKDQEERQGVEPILLFVITQEIHFYSSLLPTGICCFPKKLLYEHNHVLYSSTHRALRIPLSIISFQQQHPVSVLLR
jgi:hypothetical protein